MPPARVGAPADTAHISRLTISLATVKSSFTPLTPYAGAGFGFYRATFDRSSTTETRRGAYLHGGIEVRANDAIAIEESSEYTSFRRHSTRRAPCWGRSWRD